MLEDSIVGEGAQHLERLRRLPGLLEDRLLQDGLQGGVQGRGDVLQQDRDFRSFRGFPVCVRQRDAKGGEIQREGTLLGRDADAVELNLRGRIQRIPRSDVLEVRLTSPSA